MIIINLDFTLEIQFTCCCETLLSTIFRTFTFQFRIQVFFLLYCLKKIKKSVK